MQDCSHQQYHFAYESASLALNLKVELIESGHFWGRKAPMKDIEGWVLQFSSVQVLFQKGYLSIRFLQSTAKALFFIFFCWCFLNMKKHTQVVVSNILCSPLWMNIHGVTNSLGFNWVLVTGTVRGTPLSSSSTATPGNDRHDPRGYYLESSNHDTEKEATQSLSLFSIMMLARCLFFCMIKSQEVFIWRISYIHLFWFVNSATLRLSLTL